MKLSHVFAKLTSSSKAMGLFGGLAVAAAAVTLAVPAAGAQQFGIGVRIGGPRYVVPAPAPVYRAYGSAYVAPYGAPAYVAPAPGYWDHHRWEEQRAHDEWLRQHEFYGHPYRGY